MRPNPKLLMHHRPLLPAAWRWHALTSSLGKLPIDPCRLEELVAVRLSKWAAWPQDPWSGDLGVVENLRAGRITFTCVLSVR